MSELVLDLDAHELAVLEELAEQNNSTVQEVALNIFKRQINSDLADITPTTALMNQIRGK